MPRVEWPLAHGRPSIQVILTLAADGQPFARNLIADTGAGSQHAAFELIQDEHDCKICGGNPDQSIVLGGAYAGAFPTYVLRAQLPALGFDEIVRAVGVSSVPAGFDGIACFNFLNRFTYGNFGDVSQFGLEH